MILHDELCAEDAEEGGAGIHLHVVDPVRHVPAVDGHHTVASHLPAADLLLRGSGAAGQIVRGSVSGGPSRQAQDADEQQNGQQ